jgi:hypothetical protein
MYLVKAKNEPFINIFNNEKESKKSDDKCDCPIRPTVTRDKIGKVNKILEEERILAEKQKELRVQLGDLSKEVITQKEVDIQDEPTISTEQIKKKLISDKLRDDNMININYYCNQGKEKEEPKITDCSSLEKTDFDPNWNYQDVERLYKTKNGKKIMNTIDNNFRILRNKTLTNNIITKCFPSYMQSNIKLQQEEETPEIKPYQEESILYQEENPLDVPIILMNDDDQQIDGDVEYDELNQMINENFESKIINKFVPKANKCDMKSLRLEIRSSVSRHYVDKVNMMERENIFPIGSNKQKVYNKYHKKFDYMVERSMLEIQNLISTFKNKKYSIYQNELNRIKLSSPSGLPLSGTDYYIPWNIIDKYEVCFAKMENKRAYPVQYLT